MRDDLERMLNQSKTPGASVAMFGKDDKIITEVAGIIHIRTAAKITSATMFNSASLTKPFFAYIVLKLIEQGQFSRPGQSPESALDRPLMDITPEFGPPSLRQHPYQKLLTVRKVLSHQTGLPNWFQPGKKENYQSKPGVDFNYSGLGFCSLNDVVEKVTGQTLDQLAQQTFKKLGMKNSSITEPASYAKGHFSDGKPDNRKFFYRSNPAASLFTTAADYARFLQACLHDEFIKQHIFRPQIQLSGKDHKAPKASDIYWGLGMGLQLTVDGSQIAFHWGDAESHRAFTAINLKTLQAVVCLTNGANGPRLFKTLCEPIVGNLNSVWQWLSHREGLELELPQNLTSTLQKNLSLFKSLEKNYLIENRHESSKLQHEYDKRFGLVLYKS